MRALLLLIILAMQTVGGCTSEPPVSSSTTAREENHGAAGPTSRIDIPPTVRQNLGITFASVERRPVRQTLRFPGEFELRPEARREHRAMVPGRINLHVRQFDRVEADAILFTLDSPQWRELQHEAVEAQGAIKTAQAALDVADAQKAETQRAAAFMRQRLESLASVQMRKVELEAELAALENQVPRLDAEIQAKRVELDEAQEHYRSRLNTMASLIGMTVDELLVPVMTTDNHRASEWPRWRTLDRLEVRADRSGIVETLEVTNGGWVETGGLVLVTVDPDAIRFRAMALQSDLMRLHDGQQAQIVPPQGAGIDMQSAIDTTISVAFRAASDQRTIPLYAVPQTIPAWAKPGVSAFLDVFIGGDAVPDLAIPVSAVVRDGLTPVFFRRDPRNPDKVIRTEADLGPSDGRWIVINSGVKQGDEVVLDGAYQLMLATSGTVAKGGHFHADGTFHADDDH